MADSAGVAKIDIGLDLSAHEATYESFIALTQNLAALVLSIVLLLVLWGLEGHGGLALVGLILACIASALGSVTGMGWKLGAGVFVLIGILCILG